MGSKLPLASEETWHAYYRGAETRRRKAGWRRHSDLKPFRRRKLSPTRALGIVMGLATVAVLISLVLPT